MFTRQMEHLKEMHAKYPENTDHMKKLAETFVSNANYTEAIDVYKKYLQIKPEDPLVHNQLGMVYKTLRLFPAAIDCFREAIRIAPKYVVAYRNIGASLISINLFKEAVQFLEASIRISPGAEGVRLNLAHAYQKLGMNKEAISQLEQAFELTPKNWRIRYRLGLLYEEIGDIIQAFQVAQEIYPLSRNAHDSEEIKTFCKRVREIYGEDYSGGGDVFEDEVDVVNQEASQKSELSNDRSEEDFPFSLDDPVILLQRNIFKKPDGAEPRVALAEYYYATGEFDQAVLVYREAVNILLHRRESTHCPLPKDCSCSNNGENEEKQ